MSVFVKTVADIQLGVKVEADTYFEAVDSFLQDAEVNYVKPYLGDELFEAMSAPAYDAIKLAKVSKWLKIATSCFAFYHIIHEGSLKLNEHGAKQSVSDKATPAPKWRDDNQKSELIKKGDNALDQLLDILIDNPADFPEFASSKWYAIRTTLLINKATVFNDFVPIGNSTRVFLRLLPDMRKADRLLDSYICPELPARLRDHMADPEDSEPAVEAIDNLMPYVRAVIAYETIIRAIAKFNFFITPEGIQIYSINDGTFTKNAASSSDKKEMKEQYRKDLDEAIAELKAYLGQNLTDFPEYAGSTCAGVKSVTKSPAYAFENVPGQKFFAP